MLGALGGFAFGKNATQAGSAEREKDQAAKASPPNAESNASRSGWDKWGPAAGAALLAAGAAGAAYYKRDEVTSGWTWAGDHMKYVKNLWDEKAMKARVENVVAMGEALGVVFKTYVEPIVHFCLRLHIPSQVLYISTREASGSPAPTLIRHSPPAELKIRALLRTGSQPSGPG